jgi:outer membrane receptor for ferrienterochelin and colicin
LLDIPVVSASRFEQKSSETPSTVSVVTQDDIRQYGWRTLGEVLRSLRGFYVHYDRGYEYVGTRGFARPQDFNTRVLLLGRTPDERCGLRHGLHRHRQHHRPRPRGPHRSHPRPRLVDLRQQCCSASSTSSPAPPSR